MLEIWYAALPSCLLPSLFKTWPWGPKLPRGRASWVVRRPSSTTGPNDISVTARPSALIFDMLHHLEDLYQDCSNGGFGDQNGSAAGVWGPKMKYT